MTDPSTVDPDGTYLREAEQEEAERLAHGEKCRACDGTGIKRPKPEWTEDPGAKKEPTQNNITTPKNERPHGTRVLRELFERAGDALHDDLGYTKDTPLYYIAHAVLTDWLDSRAA